MATIAFCMLPLEGPMNGALSLAKPLRERGHQVYFVGMPDCEELVAPHDFAFVPIYSQWFPKGYMRWWQSGGASPFRVFLERRKIVLRGRDHFRFLMRGGHHEFREVMEGVRPELLIIDGSHAPTWALLAHQAGLKSVYLHTTIPPAADPERPPTFTMLLPRNTAGSRWRMRLAWWKFFLQRYCIIKTQTLCGFGYDWIAYTRKLARVCGYPVNQLNTKTMFSVLLRLPQIILYPREFEFPGGAIEGHHYIEAAIDWDRQDVDFPWEQIDPQKQLIYCSLGSIHTNKRFFQSVIDAVRRETDWQLVMTIGDHLQADAFSNVPANSVLVHRAPQLKLLGKAELMITHGGINSIRECIYYKVPMVMFPIAFDQPGAAARVVFHGLGLAGSWKSMSADQIHTLISTVLRESSIRSRIGRMSEIFRKAEAEQRGVRLIEAMLADSLVLSELTPP